MGGCKFGKVTEEVVKGISNEIDRSHGKGCCRLLSFDFVLGYRCSFVIVGVVLEEVWPLCVCD